MYNFLKDIQEQEAGDTRKSNKLKYLERSERMITIKVKDPDTGIMMNRAMPLSLLKPVKLCPKKDGISKDDFNLVTTHLGVVEALKFFQGEGLLSLDIETRGTEPYLPDTGIVGIGLTTADGGNAYFDFTSKDMNNLAVMEVIWFIDKHKPGFIVHNMAFEWIWFKVKFGIDLNVKYDTFLLLKNLMNEDQNMRYGLKDSQVRLLGYPAKFDIELDEHLVKLGHYKNIKKARGGEAQILIKNYKEPKFDSDGVLVDDGNRWAAARKDQMHLARPSILGHYCVMDCHTTYQLLSKVIIPSIKGLVNYEYLLEFHQLRIRTCKKHAIQQMKGITVDKPLLEKHLVRLNENLVEAESDFKSDPKVNKFIMSQLDNIVNDHLARKPEQYKKQKPMGLPPAEFTKAGKPSKTYAKYMERKAERERTGPEERNDYKVWQAKLEDLQDSPGQFNMNSNAQMIDLLYGHKDAGGLGFIPESYTSSGQPAVGKEAFPFLGMYGKMLKRYSGIKKELGYAEKLHAKLQLGEDNIWRVHPQIVTSGTVTGRPSGTGGFNCFPQGVEYLTQGRGWVDVSDIRKDEKVWQVNASTKEGSWADIDLLVEKEFEGNLHSFGGRAGRLNVTPEHRMAWYGGHNQKHRYMFTGEAKDLFPQSRLTSLMCTINKEDDLPPINLKELRQALAIQADGSYKKARSKNHPIYCIGVRKERKSNRLAELFGEGTYDKGSNTMRWNYLKYKSKFLCETSAKNLDLTSVSVRYREELLREISFWDGHERKGLKNTKGVFYFSNNKHNIDEIQAYFSRCGYSTFFREKEIYKGTLSYSLYITSHQYKDIKKAKNIKHIPYKGTVYCVGVQDGHLLVRSEGRTWVTGNCLQVPKSKLYLECFRPRKGRAWVDYDFKALEMVVGAELSKDKNMTKLYHPDEAENDVYLFNCAILARDFGVKLFQPILDDGYDPYNPTPESIALVKKKHKKLRALSKVATLGKQYGMGWRKFQENMGKAGEDLSDSVCQDVIKGLDKVYAGMGQYIKTLEKEHSRRDGYLITALGEIACCSTDQLKDIGNRQIQRTGHSVLLLWIDIYTRMLDKEGIDWQPVVLDFYDESLIECREEDVERVCQIMEHDSLVELTELIGGDLPHQLDGGEMACLAEAKCSDFEIEGFKERTNGEKL